MANRGRLKLHADLVAVPLQLDNARRLCAANRNKAACILTECGRSQSTQKPFIDDKP